MSKIKPEDSAFPVPPDTSYASVFECGLTKREYFATNAQQAMLNNPITMQWAVREANNKQASPSLIMARAAVDHADALIDALGEEK